MVTDLYGSKKELKVWSWSFGNITKILIFENSNLKVVANINKNHLVFEKCQWYIQKCISVINNIGAIFQDRGNFLLFDLDQEKVTSAKVGDQKILVSEKVTLTLKEQF